MRYDGGVGGPELSRRRSRACSSVIKPPNRPELGIERPTRRVWSNNMLDKGRHGKIPGHRHCKVCILNSVFNLFDSAEDEEAISSFLGGRQWNPSSRASASWWPRSASTAMIGA